MKRRSFIGRILGAGAVVGAGLAASPAILHVTSDADKSGSHRKATLIVETDDGQKIAFSDVPVGFTIGRSGGFDQGITPHVFGWFELEAKETMTVAKIYTPIDLSDGIGIVNFRFSFGSDLLTINRGSTLTIHGNA